MGVGVTCGVMSVSAAAGASEDGGGADGAEEEDVVVGGCSHDSVSRKINTRAKVGEYTEMRRSLTRGAIVRSRRAHVTKENVCSGGEVHEQATWIATRP